MTDSSEPIATGPAGNPASKRELAAWAFYDFANSGYTTVVMTTVYSAYFVGVIAAGMDQKSPGTATLMWTLAIGIANGFVLFAGPIIGAIADQRARKKRYLLMSSIMCIAGTVGLALVGPGEVPTAMLLLVLATIAFALGENLIASFLPEIAHHQNMGRISGYGWSLGYFGGLLTLGICLFYINGASDRGEVATDYVPVALLITAAIFAITACPTFLWLRERAQARPPIAGVTYFKLGLTQVGNTLRQAAHMPDLFRFLQCLTLFQAGVATVVVVAAIYAQEEMGFDTQQLIMLIMVVNLTAAIGAFAFGHAQDYFGSVRSLAVALLVWIAAIIVTLLADAPGDLWLAGNLMGLAMGATQAGGRALIGQLTPESRNAEIFGLWGLANRAAAIIGPVSYGIISELSDGNHPMAMISTLAFFLLGLILLFSVNEERGKLAAAEMAQKVESPKNEGVFSIKE